MSKKNKYLKYIPLTLIAIVLIYIQVKTTLELPTYMMKIVNNGIMMYDMHLIWTYGLDMLIITSIGMIATILISYFAAKVSAGIAKDLRNDVFEKVEGYSLNEFDKFSTASLITRNTNDIQQITVMIFMLIRMVLSAPIMAVGGIMKAVETSKEIAWILAVSIPVALIFIVVGILLLVPKFNLVQKYVDQLNLVSRQNLTGIRVIRAFRNEKFEEEKFGKVNKDLTKTNLFLNRMMVLLMPATMLILDLTQIGIVWFGAKALETNSIQIGNIMAFINYAMQVMFSFIMITMGSITLPRALVSWKRVREVLNTNSSVKDKVIAKDDTDDGDNCEEIDADLTKVENTIVTHAQNSVEFKDVSFSYPGADEKVLSSLNFKANAGKVTAIIGSTGCGKSTLVNLIPRFYDVTQGSVLINDIDVRDYTQNDLHERIGYVPQKAVMFSGSIESNIKLGNKDSTDEDMELVSSISQAEEFINEKEDKYQAEIAQGGTNISGGQKQRLSIARALIRKADIYIFDDSFSALDFKTDRKLRKELSKYTKQAVTIIVAQRVSSIMDADQIIVLDEGKIVGKGTHKQLLDNCEVYKEIASSQLSKEELENGR